MAKRESMKGHVSMRTTITIEGDDGSRIISKWSSTDEPTITIPKVQLRKLLDNAVQPVMPAPQSAELCSICESYDGHTPDCELEALRKLAE